jgi:hypothetical protein
VSTESALLAILSGVITVGSGIMLVIGRFALQRMDRGLGDVAELKAAVLGSNGRGGMVEAVQDLQAVQHDHALRLDRMERERN